MSSEASFKCIFLHRVVPISKMYMFYLHSTFFFFFISVTVCFSVPVCASFVALMLFLPVCLPDGAAMRAGVQTGDRIIKVLCSLAAVCLNFLFQARHSSSRLPSCGQSAFLLSVLRCG